VLGGESMERKICSRFGSMQQQKCLVLYWNGVGAMTSLYLIFVGGGGLIGEEAYLVFYFIPMKGEEQKERKFYP
jgi:hypothetical protein